MFAHRSVSLQLFLVLCIEVYPYSYFWSWGYFWGLWVSIGYDRCVLSEGYKNYFMDWRLMNSQSTFLFLTYYKLMAVLSKSCKPDDFELHNSVKLSFTKIWGLRSNFIDCASFLESKSADILDLCETSLDDSTDSGNFSVRSFSSIKTEGF